jgi:branched-chain amino acid transport system ATP-binding protein
VRGLLQVSGLGVTYGGIKAVKGIDLSVNQGEMVALIGANGAGKTTTLKAICGLLHHTGKVRYRDQDVSHLPSYRLVEQGLVHENLEMGAYCRKGRAEIAADLDRTYALFPRLSERRNQTAGTLSGGEQQMLAIGRALMSRPQLLLLDEPSMGLAPMMVEKIFETVRMVSSEGVTVLLVEQNAKLALEASHRGYVMESGLISVAGDARALLANPQVRQAYLGE